MFVNETLKLSNQCYNISSYPSQKSIQGRKGGNIGQKFLCFVWKKPIYNTRPKNEFKDKIVILDVKTL